MSDSPPKNLFDVLREAGFDVAGVPTQPLDPKVAADRRFTVCATSLAILALIEELRVTDDRAAECVLRGCWLFVHDDVMSQARCPPHAHQVINEYFTHGGDWKAMRECITKHALGTGAGDDVQLAELVAEKFATVKGEYEVHSAVHRMRQH